MASNAWQPATVDAIVSTFDARRISFSDYYVGHRGRQGVSLESKSLQIVLTPGKYDNKIDVSFGQLKYCRPIPDEMDDETWSNITWRVFLNDKSRREYFEVGTFRVIDVSHSDVILEKITNIRIRSIVSASRKKRAESYVDIRRYFSCPKPV